MSTRTITCVRRFIDVCASRMKMRLRLFLIVSAVLSLADPSPVFAEWKIDLSRRVKAQREAELTEAGRPPQTAGAERSPASMTPVEAIAEKEESKGFLSSIFDSGEPVQDLVILHTEKGFVPSTVRVRKDGRYRIHVVNVNEQEKNVSFILDAFSEHHATYYGQVKVFTLEPKKEGTFSFQSPETSSEGRLIVFSPEITVRTPASVGER